MENIQRGSSNFKQSQEKVIDFLLENGLYLSTIILFIGFSVSIPNFFGLETAVNILSSASLKGIIAAGFTIALIAGLIDTSILGVAAFTTILTGVLYQQLGWSLAATLLTVTFAACVCAAINYSLVVLAKVNSFVVTTATGGLFLGAALFFGNGQTIVIVRTEFQDVLMARPLGIPVSVWLLFLVYTVAYIMLNHTKLGAHIYASGANANVARVTGVRTARVTMIAFALCALATALGTVLSTARSGSTLLFGTTFPSFDLAEIFTAVLLGGASLFGGSGKIERNLVAILFLTILVFGLQMLGTKTGIWLVVKGIAFVAAIIFDVIRQRRI